MNLDDRNRLWELSQRWFRAWLMREQRRRPRTEEQRAKAVFAKALLADLPEMDDAGICEAMDVLWEPVRMPRDDWRDEEWQELHEHVFEYEMARNAHMLWQMAHGWVTDEELAAHPITWNVSRRFGGDETATGGASGVSATD